MSYVRTLWVTLVIFLPLLGCNASAQSDQLLPEIDLYYKVAQNVRVDFQAKETREDGDPTTAEIGPSLDFYLRNL